jgi:hypothetical protein
MTDARKLVDGLVTDILDEVGTKAPYQARGVKRHRPTKAEVETRREALLDIISAMRPMTVRQVFYQATVRGFVEKTEAGYNKVQSDLTVLRKGGILPYDWLTDHTRWRRKPQTHSSVKEALADIAKFYRKALWTDAECHVEIWLEKEALSGVISPITDLYDVPLMVAKGYPSLSFLYGAAEYIGTLLVSAYVYHLGDFDPSGVNAGEKIEQTLRELAPAAEIHFERLAVTTEQIRDWDLPTRPTKSTDSRARRFGSAVSVELDAIDSRLLRHTVEDAINRHLPADQLEVLKAAEEDERRLINGLVGMLVERT